MEREEDEGVDVGRGSYSDVKSGEPPKPEADFPGTTLQDNASFRENSSRNWRLSMSL
jgi:hypothetical protein